MTSYLRQFIPFSLALTCTLFPMFTAQAKSPLDTYRLQDYSQCLDLPLICQKTIARAVEGGLTDQERLDYLNTVCQLPVVEQKYQACEQFFDAQADDVRHGYLKRKECRRDAMQFCSMRDEFVAKLAEFDKFEEQCKKGSARACQLGAKMRTDDTLWRDSRRDLLLPTMFLTRAFDINIARPRRLSIDMMRTHKLLTRGCELKDQASCQVLEEFYPGEFLDAEPEALIDTLDTQCRRGESGACSNLVWAVKWFYPRKTSDLTDIEWFEDLLSQSMLEGCQNKDAEACELYFTHNLYNDFSHDDFAKKSSQFFSLAKKTCKDRLSSTACQIAQYACSTRGTCNATNAVKAHQTLSESCQQGDLSACTLSVHACVHNDTSCAPLLIDKGIEDNPCQGHLAQCVDLKFQVERLNPQEEFTIAPGEDLSAKLNEGWPGLGRRLEKFIHEVFLEQCEQTGQCLLTHLKDPARFRLSVAEGLLDKAFWTRYRDAIKTQCTKYGRQCEIWENVYLKTREEFDTLRSTQQERLKRARASCERGERDACLTSMSTTSDMDTHMKLAKYACQKDTSGKCTPVEFSRKLRQCVEDNTATSCKEAFLLQSEMLDEQPVVAHPESLTRSEHKKRATSQLLDQAYSRAVGFSKWSALTNDYSQPLSERRNAHLILCGSDQDSRAAHHCQRAISITFAMQRIDDFEHGCFTLEDLTSCQALADLSTAKTGEFLHQTDDTLRFAAMRKACMLGDNKACIEYLEHVEETKNKRFFHSLEEADKIQAYLDTMSGSEFEQLEIQACEQGVGLACRMLDTTKVPAARLDEILSTACSAELRDATYSVKEQGPCVQAHARLGDTLVDTVRASCHLENLDQCTAYMALFRRGIGKTSRTTDQLMRACSERAIPNCLEWLEQTSHDEVRRAKKLLPKLQEACKTLEQDNLSCWKLIFAPDARHTRDFHQECEQGSRYDCNMVAQGDFLRSEDHSEEERLAWAVKVCEAHKNWRACVIAIHHEDSRFFANRSTLPSKKPPYDAALLRDTYITHLCESEDPFSKNLCEEARIQQQIYSEDPLVRQNAYKDAMDLCAHSRRNTEQDCTRLYQIAPYYSLGKDERVKLLARLYKLNSINEPEYALSWLHPDFSLLVTAMAMAQQLDLTMNITQWEQLLHTLKGEP